jgi:hypothetical protein
MLSGFRLTPIKKPEESSMQNQFYLSKGGKNMGPFSSEEILKKLESQEVQWTDYLYDDSKQDWIMILEYPPFTEKFNSGFARPHATPISQPDYYQTEESKHKEKAWFILREGNNYGPYSYLEILQMLQVKTLFDHDFVWHHGLDAWKKISDLSEFSPDAIRNIQTSGDPVTKEIFFRRRHNRAHYGCTLILHDNKSIYKGRSVEISAGGAGIIVPTKSLHPGQNVFLHFQPGDGVPPFNAICNIVSKQFVKSQDGTEDAQVKYGVKFTSLSTAVKESIKSFTEGKVNKPGFKVA